VCATVHPIVLGAVEVPSTLVCRAGAATSPLQQMQPLRKRLAAFWVAHIFRLDDNLIQGGSQRWIVGVASRDDGTVGNRRLQLMSTGGDSYAPHGFARLHRPFVMV
jgi:hypothetical protein